MPRKRPIPSVDLMAPENRHHITQGEVVSKPSEKEDAITMEMHFCTAFLGRNEALQVLISMAKAGSKKWGVEFVAEAQHWLEQI